MSRVDQEIELAAFIRQIDGNNDMGACKLAERILEWQAARQQAGPSDTALRRARLFLDGLHRECKEVQTLRRLLAAAPQAEQQIVGWINEDELPENYPYDAMFPFSKVDMVRMFPVYAPVAQAEQAVPSEDIAALIVRDACETDPSDPNDSDTICISANKLLEIVERHTAAAPQAEQAVEPVATILPEDPEFPDKDVRMSEKDWARLERLPAGTKLYTAPPAPDVSGLVALLEHAACPNCDGSGARYDNYGDVEQCQWCYERNTALVAHKQEGK